ncbi:MAG TPA: DUF1592 domain-containing protein, partial [Polyangiaceae bacterium]|nr:DUF1592 domain-containing protein [Polyangiaceae bacterium]
QHVDNYFAIAGSVAEAMTADDDRVAALLACKGGEDDQACLARFFASFARRAFRRPASDAELSFLNEVYAADGIDRDGLRDVITVVLNMPEFLYRLELGGDAVAGKNGAYQLSGFELATRLAYHFWQTTPDDALLAAAEQGELDDDSGYAQMVERVASDARAEESMRLFVRQWLDLDDLRPLDSLNGDPVFDAFAGADVPTSNLRDEMIDDVLAAFVYHARRDDSFVTWFTSPFAFATGDDLAAIYGVDKWDGKSEPPRFATDQRTGLLTRAALLATGTARTRPIMKGVFIRERVLCDSLPAPPANAANIPPELSRDLTSREVVEKLTEQPGSTCATCHASMINPLGFASENFDALGRLRTSEVLYDDDGSQLAVKPVRTQGVPRVWPDDTQPAAGITDLTNIIVQSGKAESCFAREYIRFAYGRKEDENTDGCALESVRAALQEGQSLQQALRAPVLRPEFRQRMLGDVQ